MTIRGAVVMIREYLIFAVVVVTVLRIPRICPVARQAASWRQKNWRSWYTAHQMHRRDPEELSGAQMDNVRRWCRCDELCLQSVQAGLESLTDDKCALVVDVLRDLCRDLEEHRSYCPIYESCRRRLVAHDCA